MKLAQAQVIKDQTGDAPVMLLDDVLSELDDVRKSFILGNIGGIQVIITCCDEEFISGRCTCGKIFHVEGGRITEEKN